MQHKVGLPVCVRYLELNKTSGIIDLKLIVQPPFGAELSPINMVEIDGQGIYESFFIPDAIGWWWVRIKSISHPSNIYSKGYFVGLDYTDYLARENGKISSLDIKLGEIQETPTQYTLLARLKDLWNKLHDLFINGLAKIKIWDGTNQANISSDGKLKVETYQASGQFDKIVIKDGEGNNYLAKVDATGRLLVSTQTVNPPETTPVRKTYTSSMAGTIDSFYVIPDGVTLRLTKLNASSEVEQQAGNVVELYYAPNGNTIELQLIDAIYVSGNADQHDLDESFIGNGTRAILLRRRRLSGGSKEIFGRWEGYY